MKHSHIGAACVLAVMAASGPTMAASANAYDPMALDNFIAASLAAGDALSAGNQGLSAPAPSGTVVAQDGPRMDADGYIIGPDGKRIAPPLKPRWRVGVFR